MNPETMVSFRCDDPALMKLYHEAESRCRWNLKDFGGDTVLVEGGGYRKIWLETQPMGGEMYALRNLQVGLNNSLMFMRHQREDGRLPGSVRADGNKVIPEYMEHSATVTAVVVYGLANLDHQLSRSGLYKE